MIMPSNVNILPEGPALDQMAALAGVRPVDTYGILQAFGHDCAGAVMVLPDGEEPGGSGRSGYSPMTPGDLQRVINALDAVPLAAAPERGFRPSLPGFQRKGLLRRTTFNMAAGNADAHAKNFSILHEPGTPAISLAPLYDVLSAIALELTGRTGRPMRADTHLGQRVGGQADLRKVTSANLVDEGVSWGIRRRAASAVVAETLDQVLAAIPATPGDARVLAIIREQAERISRS